MSQREAKGTESWVGQLLSWWSTCCMGMRVQVQIHHVYVKSLRWHHALQPLGWQVEWAETADAWSSLTSKPHRISELHSVKNPASNKWIDKQTKTDKQIERSDWGRYPVFTISVYALTCTPMNTYNTYAHIQNGIYSTYSCLVDKFCPLRNKGPMPVIRDCVLFYFFYYGNERELGGGGAGEMVYCEGLLTLQTRGPEFKPPAWMWKAECHCASTSDLSAVRMQMGGGGPWGWPTARLTPGSASDPVLKGTWQRVMEQGIWSSLLASALCTAQSPPLHTHTQKYCSAHIHIHTYAKSQEDF